MTKQLNLWNTHYTRKEAEMKEIFQLRCKMDGRKTFSSDTFRMYGFDKFIQDKQHGIGTFFAKLVKNGDVNKVGHTRSELASNHSRQIRLYEWRTQKKQP